jgi:hypothetical protein
MAAAVAVWKERLAKATTLKEKVEAIVNCGRSSGEHNCHGGPYYCCEKADALLALCAEGSK